MNIDQLITEKTQILRNNQGKVVSGIAVEDLEELKDYISSLECKIDAYQELITAQQNKEQ